MAKKDPAQAVDMNDLYAVRIKPLYNYVISERLPFLLVCAYLFFEYVRPQSVYPAIDIIPWSMLILLATIGALVTTGGARYKHSHPLNKLMVAYLVVVLLSSAFSFDSAISFSEIRTFLDWFIIYFLIVSIIDDEPRFFVFLLSFLLYSFKMSQHGFLSWALRGFAFESWGVTGAPGWFHNSGEVGIQMAIFAPLAFFFVFGLKPHWGKLKYWFFLSFPITAIATAIASSSRGALVGVAAAFMLPLLKSKYFVRGMLAFMVVAVVVVNVIPEESMARFQESGEDETSRHRMERWEHGFDAMLKNPVLGVGHEAWEAYHPNYYHIQERGTSLVHNVFVQCGSELGFTGLLVFLLMIFHCCVSNIQVRKMASALDNRYLGSIASGLDAALVGYLVSASFVTVHYYPYFWIHCALVTCLHHAAQRQAAAAGVSPMKKKFA